MGCNAHEYLQGNLAEDILFKGTAVRITPEKLITTSNSKLKVGDSVNFVISRDVEVEDEVVINRNTQVRGKVISLIPNKIVCMPAKIVIGEFETTDVFGETVPLKGQVKKEGNPHNTLVTYINILSVFVRGGEAHIIPDEDYYIVFY